MSEEGFSDSIISRADLSYVRPVRRQMVEDKLRRFVKLDHLEAATYPDAVILPGIKRKGGVVDRDGAFVAASRNRWIGGYYELPEGQTVVDDPRRVVYLGPYEDAAWGHVFTNVITRCWYFFENDDSVDAYVLSTKSPTQKCNNAALNEMLRLVGLENRIEIVNEPTRFAEVVVPECSFDGASYHPHFMKVVDAIVDNALREEGDSEIAAKKVFLSRSRFRRARVNEGGLDLLDHYFAKNGFTIVHPEKLSAVQAIKLMREADVLASESGSISFNALYAREDTKVIVVERIPSYPDGNLILNLAPSRSITFIDGCYGIFPVGVGECCILAYTDQFEQFSSDNDYEGPDEEYADEAFFREALNVYSERLKHKYPSGFAMRDSVKKWVPAFSEAYEDAKEKYPWLEDYRAQLLGQG